MTFNKQDLTIDEVDAYLCEKYCVDCSEKNNCAGCPVVRWSMVPPVLRVDDDGYIGFEDKSPIGNVEWRLSVGVLGWEAYLPGEDDPCLVTGVVTFPSDDYQAKAMALLEVKVGKKVSDVGNEHKETNGQKNDVHRCDRA